MTTLFSGVVRIKNIGEFIDGDASAVIFDVDNDFFGMIVNVNEDDPSLDLFVFTGFFDLIFGIVDDVEQGLHKLIFIAADH